MQSRLFNEIDNDAQLQRPPVLAFTCIRPKVKVWLVFHHKSNFLGTAKRVRKHSTADLEPKLTALSVWFVYGLRLHC